MGDLENSSFPFFTAFGYIEEGFGVLMLGIMASVEIVVGVRHDA